LNLPGGFGSSRDSLEVVNGVSAFGRGLLAVILVSLLVDSLSILVLQRWVGSQQGANTETAIGSNPLCFKFDTAKVEVLKTLRKHI
jgi:hypothetical protein